MIRIDHLHLIGVPRKVAGWFQTSVQVLARGNFLIPVWLVQDALGYPYSKDMPLIRFNTLVDVRRKFLVLHPLAHTKGVALRATEFLAERSKWPMFYRVRLPTIAEIFQVEPPVRYPVSVSRKDGVLIVRMRKGLDSSPCIK